LPAWFLYIKLLSDELAQREGWRGGSRPEKFRRILDLYWEMLQIFGPRPRIAPEVLREAYIVYQRAPILAPILAPLQGCNVAFGYNCYPEAARVSKGGLVVRCSNRRYGPPTSWLYRSWPAKPRKELYGFSWSAVTADCREEPNPAVKKLARDVAEPPEARDKRYLNPTFALESPNRTGTDDVLALTERYVVIWLGDRARAYRLQDGRAGVELTLQMTEHLFGTMYKGDPLGGWIEFGPLPKVPAGAIMGEPVAVSAPGGLMIARRARTVFGAEFAEWSHLTVV
jgi:hypothetical protein